MRVLFAAYCAILPEPARSLIGVYKRCLRIGLEMKRRGHDVWIHCPGRRGYSDEMTREAEARLYFADLPAGLYSVPSVDFRRSYHRVLFHKLKLDLVVIGEAPFGGNLHDCTVAAVSLGKRTVLLDNTYQPTFPESFLKDHGAMFDGVILNGLRSAQPVHPPAHYCGVPPYLEGSGEEAAALLGSLGMNRRPLVAVLAYDRWAERLAANVLARVEGDCFDAVFLSPDGEGCRARVLAAGLPAERVAVLPPPSENLLYGLLKLARLAIGKCGFMQISECLALGTPFLGIHYSGCLPQWTLRGDSARFVHVVESVEADRAAVKAVRQYLNTAPEALAGLVEPRMQARGMAADFLEALPAELRAGTLGESAAWGYSPELLAAMLREEHAGQAIEIRDIRCSLLRQSERGWIHSVVCRYLADGRVARAVLWGHIDRISGKAALEKDRGELPPE